MDSNKFIMRLAAELVSSVNNNYQDNYDHNRFGEAVKVKEPPSLRKSFISLINKTGFYNNFNNHLFSKQIENADYPLTDFIYLYNILEDQYSKDLLIKIVAYRLLGHTKVKLPLSTPEFWKNQEMIEAHQSKEDVYPVNFMELKLHLINLEFLGLPVKMYNSPLGANMIFVIKQYELHRHNVHIQAEEGETVIDGGGCYGDTALYFANKTGTSGQVHVFEFIPDNINLYNKNLGLNPALAKQIKLVNHPLWEVSGKRLYYLSNGPGSLVKTEPFEGYTGETTTLSIDDYAEKPGLEKIDFIKLDIEGAELNALQGATKSINHFKPKLAVALYHNTKDFDTIPRFISGLKLGYKFYLSHSTIYGEETMLFAKAE